MWKVCFRQHFLSIEDGKPHSPLAIRTRYLSDLQFYRVFSKKRSMRRPVMNFEPFPGSKRLPRWLYEPALTRVFIFIVFSKPKKDHVWKVCFK